MFIRVHERTVKRLTDHSRKKWDTYIKMAYLIKSHLRHNLVVWQGAEQGKVS